MPMRVGISLALLKQSLPYSFMAVNLPGITNATILIGSQSSLRHNKAIQAKNSTIFSSAYGGIYGKAAVVACGGTVNKEKQGWLKSQLEKAGLILHSYEPRYHRIMCPQCGGGTSGERSLSLTIKEDLFAVWICHRGKCGFHGCSQNFTREQGRAYSEHVQQNGSLGYEEDTKLEACLSVNSLGLSPLSEVMIQYFADRRISKETLERNHVMQLVKRDQVVLAFTYWQGDELVNCKFRTSDKKFWQVTNPRKVFYGLNDIKGFTEVVIVEGEIDKLSMEEAGIMNCVSVPEGAPSKLSEETGNKEMGDKKFEFLRNCEAYFGKVTRIILATDADEPGSALAEELARRLGRERCWRVKWPIVDGKQLKDANEVLIRLGAPALQNVIEEAEIYPICGLFQFSFYFNEIEGYYFHNEEKQAVSTGWRQLDNLYRIVPGELTVVTGVPNSGKSEWIDALICNLNSSQGWTFALCSMENKVKDHARKLLEKHLKKPFFYHRASGREDRISREDLETGKHWLNQNFVLIRCEDEELPSVEWILERAKAAVLRHGIRGLVVDPYNELDHQRPSNQTETEYVSRILTKIKRFAQHHDCHVWFVAHPRQMQNWRGEPPSMYDISGSAHFINKCDNGVVVHRNWDMSSNEVQILIRKVRNKLAGQIGNAVLKYDRVTGQYFDA